MMLLNLAPDIQEELLFLPRVEDGQDSIFERDLWPVAAEMDWGRQRRMWNNQTGLSSPCRPHRSKLLT